MMVGETGLEPATSRSQSVHSSQLSYSPVSDFVPHKSTICELYGGQEGIRTPEGVANWFTASPV